MLGTMVAGNDALDYAVIQFDPQKVSAGRTTSTTSRSTASAPTRSPATSRASWAAPPATRAASTWGPGEEPGTIVNQVCGQPGDSGAPVTVNNRLVGMIHGAFTEDLPTCVIKFIPLHTPAVTMSINARARRHHRQEPAGIRLRSGRGADRRCSGYLLGPDRLEHRGIHQRRRVAEFATLGDVAQQPPHDLAAAGLGQLRNHVNLARPRDLSDLLGDLLAQLVDHVVVVLGV